MGRGGTFIREAYTINRLPNRAKSAMVCAVALVFFPHHYARSQERINYFRRAAGPFYRSR